MKHNTESKTRIGRPPLAPIANEIKLTFPSISINEGMSRAAVGAIVAQLDPTMAELTDIKCALSEAVTNCIVHAYPDCIGKITLTIRLRVDRSFTIEIKDNGVGIADIKQAREPLFTGVAGGERSGMGFTVMESFTDRVGIRSKPGYGTVVTLTKRLVDPIKV